MTWQDILKNTNFDLYEIRSRFGKETAEEVERMIYLRDNEDILFELIDDIERNKINFGLKAATKNAVNNLNPSSKYDGDIFFYNLDLDKREKYERFKKNPSVIIDDELNAMLSGFAGDL
tara:strand:+ start:3163 stop:3519 length:357 start_codon:yes stop_codon:yes gene_type:complete